MSATMTSPRRPTFASRFLRQRLAVIALGFVALAVLVAALAPLLAPYRPEATDLRGVLQGPTSGHWLGTDDLGRDTLSRLIFGTQASLRAALQATSLAVVAGVPLGLVAGFVGGRTDRVLSRIADTFMTFPPLVLAIVIVGLLGPSLTNAMVAVGIVYAPRLFRIGRSAALAVVPETYISAARATGCTPLAILVRHVLPNALSPILVQMSLMMGTSVLAEASLSFLGLGVQPPDASWGSILGRSVPFIETQPIAVIASGAAISALVLAFNLVGDGLRDSVGRRTRG